MGNGLGIGVRSSTLYQRSSADFAWYKGGVHNDAAFSSGGGTSLMTLDINGNLNVTGSLVTWNGIRFENNWSDADGGTRASKSAIANDTAVDAPALQRWAMAGSVWTTAIGLLLAGLVGAWSAARRGALPSRLLVVAPFAVGTLVFLVPSPTRLCCSPRSRRRCRGGSSSRCCCR